MKKRYLLGLMIICLFISGCGNKEMKEVTTLDNFNAASTGFGFTINDNSDNYTSYDYITGSSVASIQDMISIEMIVYDSAESAEKVQEGHIESFNLLKSTGASEEKDKGGNYYRYVLISNGYYMVSSRVDNTLIFCKTLLENKDKVLNVMNSLGY